MSVGKQRTVVVLANGAITVPKSFRNKLGWAPGTELTVETRRIAFC